MPRREAAGFLVREEEPSEHVSVAADDRDREIADHRQVSLGKGDTVVLSSRIIPGNEKSIYRMINHISRRGAEVIYGHMNPPVHVSGHASSGELKLVLNLVKPRYFIPVHGEYRQLSQHAALAAQMGYQGLEETFILETGQTLVIDSKGARRGGEVPVGRLCIDSGTLDEVVEDLVIRDRRHLSEDGFVVPVVSINRITGKSEGVPELVSRGFISEDGSDLLQRASGIVVRTLEESSAEERSDSGVIQEKIRRDLKRFLNKQAAKRPLILPVILEV